MMLLLMACRVAGGATVGSLSVSLSSSGGREFLLCFEAVRTKAWREL